MMWVKRTLEALFPGGQLQTLLQMIGIFALIAFYAAIRVKVWQRYGGGESFLTKQRFQTLFSNDNDGNETRE
jgi:hypothetical protein